MQTPTGALISIGVVVIILIVIACFLRVCLRSGSGKSDTTRIRTNMYRDALGTAEVSKCTKISLFNGAERF